MRKKILKIIGISILSIIALIVLTLTVLFIYNRIKYHNPKTEDIKYMLIKKTGWVLFDTIQPTNMALLITDTKEMKEAQELFLAKQTTAHMCGYHYKISFLYDTDSIYTWTSFNKKCEVFDYKPVKTQKLLDYYGNQLETNPTHYIYDVKIPVTIKPDEAKEMLKHSGLMVFFLNGKSEYYNRNANTYTYSVQIVDTSNDIEVIKQKLKPYAFITEISKYDR